MTPFASPTSRGGGSLNLSANEVRFGLVSTTVDIGLTHVDLFGEFVFGKKTLKKFSAVHFN